MIQALDPASKTNRKKVKETQHRVSVSSKGQTRIRSSALLTTSSLHRSVVLHHGLGHTFCEVRLMDKRVSVQLTKSRRLLLCTTRSTLCVTDEVVVCEQMWVLSICLCTISTYNLRTVNFIARRHVQPPCWQCNAAVDFQTTRSVRLRAGFLLRRILRRHFRTV